MKTINYYINESKRNLHSDLELDEFLVSWDTEYKKSAQNINLFNKMFVEKWTIEQRQKFVKNFYHSRGHFKDFLWHLGNFAPDEKTKEIILKNISEEFGGNGWSHEQLYLDFAKKECVNLTMEFIENNFHNINMEKFNKLHIEWLYMHPEWISKLSAFSAYERLDSTDYELLSHALFPNLEQEDTFFKIHREAEHFDKTYESLLDSWNKDESLVRQAFSFIANTQLDMWKDLSNEVFNYTENN